MLVYGVFEKFLVTRAYLIILELPPGMSSNSSHKNNIILVDAICYVNRKRGRHTVDWLGKKSTVSIDLACVPSF